MKLVIDTQYCENYGAHTWDGKGECPQRWKFKGGSTYVVPGITPAQKARIERDGIPTLQSLLEYSSAGSREYVIEYRVVEDDARVGEEWETPFELAYEDGMWVARRYVVAGDYWQPGYEGKREEYTMTPNGGREDYICEYVKKAA
jgi:hypothetical protein